MLAKPPEIAADAYKSAKWDELAAGRDLGKSDAPALSLLCQWHKIARDAMAELDAYGGTAYENDAGDLRAYPQIATLKAASAEIRQLNKQLGIADAAGPGEGERGGDVLSLVSGRRAERRAEAAG